MSAMCVANKKNIDITKVMTTYKLTIRYLTISVMMKIVFKRNLLHLKMQRNSKFIECKFIRNMALKK